MTNAHFIPTPSLHNAAAFRALAGTNGQARAMRVGVSATGADGSGVQVVYGAPGTGKSTALVGRFLALVEAGLQPEQILVLAATRESAARLRDQLLIDLAAVVGAGSAGPSSTGSSSELPTYAVEGPLARTVSSVAFGIVKRHALEAGLKAPELISGAEQDAMFVQLLAQHEGRAAADLWPAHITPVTRGLTGFRSELRDLISACQEHSYGSSMLAAFGKNGRPEWVAAATVFEAYEQLLASGEFAHRFDAPSMVNRAIQILETDDESLYESGYRAILVDDAQELTPSSARFIYACMSEDTELVLFGDPDATTLGFRHASPAIMGNLAHDVCVNRGEYAGNRAGTVEVINFEADPFGKPEGLAYALGRVSRPIHPEGAAEKRAVFAGAKPAAGSGVVVEVFTSPQAEAEWLALQLRKAHIEGKVAWHDMAVVGRTRQVLEALERLLAAESVPVRILGAQTALRDEFASRALLDLAQLVTGGFELTVESAERLIRSPFCGLDSVEMRRFRRELRREEAAGDGTKNSDDLLLELFENENSLATIEGREGKSVRRFLKTLAAAKLVAQDPMQTIEDLLWALWKPSGLAAKWSELGRGLGEIGVQANRNLDAVVALFAAANRFVERNPGAAKEQFIAAQLDQAVAEDSLSYSSQGGQAVNLLTPAGLVGRRFQIVAIPQLIEGVWPNLKPRSTLLGANVLAAGKQHLPPAEAAASQNEMADELRMFYKALGAANGRVLVSSYTNEEEQVSQFLQLVADTIPEARDFTEPSYTLRGMAGNLRRRLAVAFRDNAPDRVKAELASKLQRLAAAGVAGAHPDDWYGLAPISTEAPLFVFTDSKVELPEGQIDEEVAIGGDTGSRIPIYPSQLENFLKCPLHWFLESHGAKDKDFEAHVGTLIHESMELAADNSEETLWQHVDSRWHTLRFESEWLEQKERRRAQKLVRTLSQYLGDFERSGGSLLANEIKFEFNSGRAVVQGRIDRVEQMGDGKIVIADLKTGKNKPAVGDMPTHAQLGLYQLALANSNLTQQLQLAEDAQLGGAKLIFIVDKAPTLRTQEPLTSENEQWFTELIDRAVTEMSLDKSKTFVAKVSSHCEKDNEFGSCHMHLVKAVSYLG